MNFATIHTTAGLQAMYDADQASVAVSLTHMAVGDGGGAPVTPDEAQVALVGEVYRATINRIFKPDAQGAPARFSAELVVPATEGGFVMREVGVFTDDGTLFAVGNLPETYKPEVAEGSYADTLVRVEFEATNADTVTLILDPNVTMATQNWVVTNMTAATIIPGGTTQQVLTKASNADGDYVWADPTDANIVVNTVEEDQVLADAQTVVNLSIVTTFGLAVYIDGKRLSQGIEADEWQPDPVDETVLTLGQSYTAGTEIILVQNEPAANFPAALLRDANLADVPDKPLARDNLGVPSLTDLQNAVPAGAVMYFARATAPSGWLIADGRAVSRTTYSGLFNAVGTLFGAGNGVDTFNLPDLRGEFLRGHDQGRGVDDGRALGTAQGAATNRVSALRIAGETNISDTIPGDGSWSAGLDVGEAGNPPVPMQARTTGDETRPRNVALLACIKA
ncbi:phage tail-collar fiber domain-containing protein [Roseovarius ramblicola]|uniref:Phage tail protein n=1 Tax=Roseovarius ramblicola TaxID=2022336 RepID=A0ABV5HYL9_9RHOB